MNNEFAKTIDAAILKEKTESSLEGKTDALTELEKKIEELETEQKANGLLDDPEYVSFDAIFTLIRSMKGE